MINIEIDLYRKNDCDHFAIALVLGFDVKRGRTPAASDKNYVATVSNEDLDSVMLLLKAAKYSLFVSLCH